MPIQLPKTVWAFIWHYVRDKKCILAGFVLIALVWAIELSLSPYLIKDIVDTVVMHHQDHAMLIQAVMWPASIYASMTLLLNLNFRLYDYLGLKMYPAIKSRMTQDMFDYLLKHSHGYFQNHFAGSLTKKIFDMITDSERIILILNEFFYARAFALIIASAMLWKVVHPTLGIILFVWTSAFIYCSYLSAKYAAKHAKFVSECYSNMSGVISDSVSNVMSTKLFYNLSHESNRVWHSLTALVNADRTLLWFNLKAQFLQGLSVFLLVIIMLYNLLEGVGKGWVTPGDFAMVLTLIAWMTSAVWEMGEKMLDLSRATGSCQQALSFIMEPHEIVDAPNAKSLVINEGKIVFDHVSHAYPGSKIIFNELSVEIKSGEKVGLVGYSGGGKSTFTRLILRLMDIKSGQILIDGQDISKVTHESLTKNIGTIPQETELFHRSIMENIRFAKPEATDAQVLEAAEKACCDEFIKELPEGYQSLVGERGVKLSGGQRQRIAIARAFLKNAPILLLDEATSALDTMTERLIQRSLHAVMEGKTTIVIAHRLSTLKDMDRILFFDQGVIVEQGSLSELLANPSGKFYQLWHMQAEGVI
ncbi:MAG: ABC transporter ATP-binding protein [Gammaproteobacteria bacterium]